MGTRKMYNTTLDVNLMREIKILAAQLDLRQNDLIEEAIQDLMKKYKKSEVSIDVSNGRIDHHGRLFPHHCAVPSESTLSSNITSK